MTIEVKFKPGDWIFVLDNNKIHKRLITTVKTWTSIQAIPPSSLSLGGEVVTTQVEYIVKEFDSDKGLKKEYRHTEVFATKEELLKSL